MNVRAETTCQRATIRQADRRIVVANGKHIAIIRITLSGGREKRTQLRENIRRSCPVDTFLVSA